MTSYLPDLFTFKKILDGTTLPPGGQLLTHDAKSMFANNATDAALSIIFPYLCETEKDFGHYHGETLIHASEIVVENNIICFGNTYRKQIRGTAMGNPQHRQHGPQYLKAHMRLNTS